MADIDILNIPSDTVRAVPAIMPPGTNLLDVDPGPTTQIIEIQVLFRLTDGQVKQVATESHTTTAVTLATRAANLLSQGEDLLIFQGRNAANNHSLFVGRRDRLFSLGKSR